MAIQSHLLGTIEVKIFFEISDMYHIFQDKPADSWQNVNHSGWVPGWIQVQTETVASGNSFHHHLGARCPTKCRHSFSDFGCSEKSLSRFNHQKGNQLVHGWMDGWTHTQISIYLSICLSVCLSVCLFFCLFCFVLFVCLFVCVCWCVYIYICIHTRTHTHPLKMDSPSMSSMGWMTIVHESHLSNGTSIGPSARLEDPG